jgi:hypothetical protein
MYAATGGLAVAVVAIIAGVVLHGASSHSAGSTAAGTAGGVNAPAVAPHPAASSEAQAQSGSGTAARTGGAETGTGSCGSARLQAELTQAVRKGASVVVGYATLTTAPAVQAGTPGAPAYASLTLRSVRTLAGPAVTSGSIAWITEAGPAAGASASPGTARPEALPPASEVFGIVSPASSGTPGPVLQAAVVQDGQVVLSGAGCWDVTVPASGSARPFTLNGPAIPLSSDAAGPTRIPVATAEKLAAAAR